MGTNLLFTVMSAYLLVYYTNYAHVNAAIVGTIMFVSKIFDAISDVAMGYVEERFAKPGAKARPWLKRMALPYAISAIILFTVPDFTSTVAQGIYVFITYNLFCTIYTMIVIPYNSLQALITQDKDDRKTTGVLRSIFSTIASTIVNSFTMIFIGWAGNTKLSWTIVIGVYAVIALIVYSLCYVNTTERVNAEEDQHGQDDKKLGFVESLFNVMKNKYWRILTVNGIFSSAVISLNMGSMFFYLAYVCGKPQSVAIVGMLLSMPMLVLIPLSAPIVAKCGEKQSGSRCPDHDSGKNYRRSKRRKLFDDDLCGNLYFCSGLQHTVVFLSASLLYRRIWTVENRRPSGRYDHVCKQFWFQMWYRAWYCTVRLGTCLGRI